MAKLNAKHVGLEVRYVEAYTKQGNQTFMVDDIKKVPVFDELGMEMVD